MNIYEEDENLLFCDGYAFLLNLHDDLISSLEDSEFVRSFFVCPRRLGHGLAACFPGVISRCFSLHLMRKMPVLRMILKFFPGIFGAQCDVWWNFWTKSMYRSLSGRSSGDPLMMGKFDEKTSTTRRLDDPELA